MLSRFSQHGFSILLAAPIALLFIAIGAHSISAASSFEAWTGLLEAPRLMPSLGMTLWTGFVSTLLAWWLTAWLLSHAIGQAWWAAVVKRLGWMLAVPHAAFAVGLVVLIAPSGWLLRIVSPWLTGFAEPPQIATSQDAFGLGLIAMLVFKETPFLLWAAATQLQRDDTATRLQREAWAAQTLGYSRSQAFWQIIWPQLKTRLRWPLLAVLAYGLTVVDVALIAGPGSPSTLSVRAWQWLQDSDAATNATGAAAGWLLTAIVALCAAVMIGSQNLPRKIFARFRQTSGARQHERQENMRARTSAWSTGRMVWLSLLVIYGSVLLALAVSSITGLWPFPALLPKSLSWEAWTSVFSSSASIRTTLVLALASSLLGLIWSVAWLELSPPRWDAVLRRLLYLPLVLPGVLWIVGLHRLTLDLQLTASWTGLLIAHSAAVLPYSLIALSPAYLGFDPRYRQACAVLGKSRWQFLSQVKWPLLRQSLWASFAVGFAVSVAQFLPTLYVGEGRFVTVTTEAVTLSSGGQRSLVAAYAWLQWLLPAICFALAAWLGRPRKFAVP